MSFVRALRGIKRIREVTNLMFKEEMGYVIDKLNLRRHLGVHKQVKSSEFEKPITSPPARLRRIMDELGGSFVKLGQALSLRYDLLPKEYCDEFSKLQDNVKPLAFETVKSAIEKELGKPISEVFKSFEKVPVASASVGQVHKAVLKDGHIVAVKVQRPGIEKIFQADIDILRYLARQVDTRYEELRMFNFPQLIEEFEKYTVKELDYTIEANNIEGFYNNFRHSAYVKIPRVYWGQTTKKIIVMEFINGKRLKDVDRFEKYKSSKQKVIANVLNSSMEQIFIHKLFHADPHPGNIFLMGNNHIAFLDFGIVGRLTEESVHNIEDFIIGIVNKDVDLIIKSILDSGSVSDGIDVKAFKADIVDSFGVYYHASMQNIDMAGFFLSIFAIDRKYQIRLPLHFTLLIKTLITLQGFTYKYYPEFDMIKFMRPWAQRLAKERARPEHIIHSIKKTAVDFKDMLVSLPSDFKSLVKVLKSGTRTEVEVRELHTLTMEMDRSSNRLTFGMILAALIVSSAILIQTGIPPLVYGIPFLAYIPLSFAAVLMLSIIISIFREGKGV